MSAREPHPPINAIDEIAALIATLHATGQRLEHLTGGEIDTVADAQGRTFFLHHAQENLRHNEAVRQAAILNALTTPIALLDAQGEIVSVNDAWGRFADANINADAIDIGISGIGKNYLAVCDSTGGEEAPQALRVAKGIRAVLSGEMPNFPLSTRVTHPQKSAGFSCWSLRWLMVASVVRWSFIWM